ncbi:GspH/FimT family pseudopilin [Marinobacterium marinum]|uniref:Type II secretion system protein H n=1 Tax=Marinobacterium marinum TaxID=2756129 RepID=A0A7W1WW52_9GAMM|nr:GspH/FimT family pseudopilin [Marinobacterium marinum]MBA4501304.1 GspH/FimT family pseudopilin [Marinobacterium marinum]
MRPVFSRLHYRSLRCRQQGLTLIEIMIAIVILGILSSIGVPSFVEMIKDNRLSAQASDLTGSMRLARSEAIKRNERVGMVSDGVDGSWSEGWDIVARPGEADEEVIRTLDALEGGNTLNCVGDCTRILFTGAGTVVASQDLRLCDDRNEGRLFSVRLTGSLKTEREEHGCQ